MKYTTVNIPLAGLLFIEYNNGHTVQYGWEWQGNELFVFLRKLRVIYTPSN